MSDNPKSSADAPCCDYALTPAYWLLRLWLGMRLVASGAEKFKEKAAGPDGVGYSMDAYKKFIETQVTFISDNTFIPAWASNAFMWPLGFVMVVVGVFILVGFFNRLSLFVGGLIFVGLSFGMMVLPDPAQTLDLGVYVGLFAAALALVKHNRLAITRW